MNQTLLTSRSVRGVAVAMTLAVVASAFPFGVLPALAAVGIDTAVLSETTVTPGTEVTVEVTGTKTGSGCDNNWSRTRVTVDGNVYESSLVSITGTGSVSDSVDFPAPTTPGSYPVLVEIMGGAESFDTTVCDDSQVWASQTLTLEVAIAPAIRIVSIAPLEETRVFGDTNPVVYQATVEVSGDPVSGHLQCVIFDIFRGDNWQTVSVDHSTPGTYVVELPYDISTYDLGTYDVVAIVSEETCANATDGGFDSGTYRANGDTDFDAETRLHIVTERFTLTVNPFGEGSGQVTMTPEGSLEEVTCSTAEEADCVGTYATGTVVNITVTPAEGSNFDSSWSTVAGNPGTCTGNTSPCQVTLSGNVSLGAHFALNSNGGGGGGGGRRSSNDDDDDDDSSDDDDAPIAQVLGQATTAIPVGAPNTGAGGTSPVSVNLPSLLAIFSTTRGIKKVN
jgi:hypothetical protein